MTARPFNLSLERILTADAVTCFAMGAILTLDASALSPWLGLSERLLFAAGLALFPCAALMMAAARIGALTVPLGRLVVAGNLLWVAGSLAVLASTAPTTLGIVVVLVQAVFGLVLAALEWRGLSAAMTPAPAR